MLIESWIAALLFVLIAVLGGIAMLGWIAASQRLNEEIIENKALVEENAKLKSKLSIARLYINLEEKK